MMLWDRHNIGFYGSVKNKFIIMDYLVKLDCSLLNVILWCLFMLADSQWYGSNNMPSPVVVRATAGEH